MFSPLFAKNLKNNPKNRQINVTLPCYIGIINVILPFFYLFHTIKTVVGNIYLYGPTTVYESYMLRFTFSFFFPHFPVHFDLKFSFVNESIPG